MVLTQDKTYPLAIGDRCIGVLDGVSTSFRLTARIGDGAEGAVFRGETDDGTAYAVKIYSDGYRQARASDLIKKLKCMVAVKAHFLKPQEARFAWPLALIFNGTRQADIADAKFVGFVMPLGDDMATFRQVIELTRQADGLPTLTQRLAMCVFLARGFAMLHEGVEIQSSTGSRKIWFAVGDVNDTNIRVTRPGGVFFFDCDSYVAWIDGQRLGQWAHTVEYASPEYHAKPKGYEWTARDDDYGLAVLIFRLLNNWERPYLYKGSGKLRTPDVIMSQRFAYSERSPDDVVPTAEATKGAYRAFIDERLKRRFEQTFLPGVRPKAEQWADDLLRVLKERRDLGRQRPLALSRPRSARRAPAAAASRRTVHPRPPPIPASFASSSSVPPLPPAPPPRPPKMTIWRMLLGGALIVAAGVASWWFSLN